MFPLLAVNMETLMDSFQLMGQGMVGIFVVLILIAIIVSVLTKITANKKDSDE